MRWTDNISERLTGLSDTVKKTQDHDQWKKFVVGLNGLRLGMLKSFFKN